MLSKAGDLGSRILLFRIITKDGKVEYNFKFKCKIFYTYV